MTTCRRLLADSNVSTWVEDLRSQERTHSRVLAKAEAAAKIKENRTKGALFRSIGIAKAKRSGAKMKQIKLS